jgi:endoribonuclease Dicer
MASQQQQYTRELNECTRLEDFGLAKKDHTVMFHIPYNLQTQHSLPDKSIADCVEALIGCYLTTCGQQAALRLMRWLGLRVLIPRSSHGIEGSADATSSCTRSSSRHEYCGNNSTTGENTHCKRRSCSRSVEKENVVYSVFGLPMPPSPLLTTLPSVQQALELHLLGFESLEEKLQYRFRDRSYLLQAFTHASYHYNNITDCYQRLVAYSLQIVLCCVM